jgi:hypothetical protein
MGLLSPSIADWVRDSRWRGRAKRALLTEVNDLRYRCAGLAYGISREQGSLSRELLSIILPTVKAYRGPYYKDYTAGVFEKLANLSDAELAAIPRDQVERSSLQLRKYSLPFLDSLVPGLPLFHPETQAQLLDLRAQVAMMHELVDEHAEFFGRTFAPSSIAENGEVILHNLASTKRSVQERALSIVKRIDGLRLWSSPR